jgi:hypothetical protein
MSRQAKTAVSLAVMTIGFACSVACSNDVARTGARQRGETNEPPPGQDPPTGEPSENDPEGEGPSEPGDAGGGGPRGCTFIAGARVKEAAPHGFRDLASIESAGIARRFVRAVWTGHEIFAWGGGQMSVASDGTMMRVSNLDDGATYDPSSDSWKKLPPAPIAAREGDVVFGDDAVMIWGGDENTNDGALFDLCTGTWSTIPQAPIFGRRLEVAVWSTTTHELIIWNGNRSSGAHEGPLGVVNDGAAYHPATRTWRMIALAPVSGTTYAGVWTGTKMVVYGGGGNHGGGSWGTPAVYDPVTDRWDALDQPIAKRQSPAGTPHGSAATFFGGYDVCHCTQTILYPTDGASWDETTRAWTVIPKIPTEIATRGSAGDVGIWWGSGKFHAYFSRYAGNGGGVYTPGGEWTAMDPGGPTAQFGIHATPMGADALVWTDQMETKLYRE